MSPEFKPGQQINPSEKPELSPVDRAQRQVEKYANDANYPFQQIAFADFVDYKMAHVHRLSDTSQSFRDRKFRIGEIIRQHREEIPGYQIEFDHVSKLHRSLHDAMYKNIAEAHELDGALSEDIKFLLNTKNKVLKREIK